MAQAIQSTRPVPQTTPRGFQLELRQGWIAGALLALMLVSVTASVAASNWVDGLWQAMYAALGGLLFAALVARLRLNGVVALLLAMIVGTAFVAWLVSSHVGAPFDATWNEKMLLIEDRLDQWLVHVLGGGIGTDTFIFLCVLVALSWVLGYASGWSVLRHHQPWGAILPLGAALLVNLFYAPPQSGLYMMLFLLAALLLLVRTTLLKRQQTWAAYAVRFANDIGLDFLTYGIIFSGLIILLSWLIPPTMPGPAWLGFVYERVRDPWQSVQDDVTRAFSTVRGTENAGPTTFFSNSLSMGGPIRLGDREVFQIESPYGRYWRAVVFDTYTGTGWLSTADQSADFIVADPRMKTMPADTNVLRERKTITETVEIRLPTDNLVISASQPVRVNDGVSAKFNVARALNGEAYLDIHSIRLDRTVKLGDKYIVVSSISAADVQSLNSAGGEIPPYIREKYLPLPDTVTDRTRKLALSITADAKTTYDKARAIETYLREKIKYNDNVEPVPAGFDGVDYLLFERPEGYCNYYASAMAVLARSIGIPARVASGYAVGGASDDGYYHIKEANAHSWPELYFGELGWIEFEPTASQPEISRPVPQTDANRADELNKKNQPDDPGTKGLGDKRLQDQENQDRNARPGLPAGLFTSSLATLGYGILFLGLVGFGGFSFVQWRWKRYLGTLKPGARAAAEMYRLAPLAGFLERPDATAAERALHLGQLMPTSQAEISNVADIYVRERYSGIDLSSEEGADARIKALRIQKQMWYAVYQRFIGNNIAAARAFFRDLKQQAVQKTKPAGQSRVSDVTPIVSNNRDDTQDSNL